MRLTVHNLHKSYAQSGRPIAVLKGLDLVVESGQSVAIIGRSGSGKSTLLSLLAGLDDATSGQILLDQHDLAQMTEVDRTQLRGKKMGIVFQQFHLVDSLTAVENVELPLLIQGEEGPAARSKALELLKQVGLEHRAAHFPRHLSGGESQRVAIARALIHEPEFILADEPSGNLDQVTGQQVMSLFFRLLKERQVTTVLVTHSQELAGLCDRILELSDGQLGAL